MIVTRMDESDSGTELRLEVHLDGAVLELVCTDGMSGREVDLMQLGPDPEHRYRGFRQIVKAEF